MSVHIYQYLSWYKHTARCYIHRAKNAKHNCAAFVHIPFWQQNTFHRKYQVTYGIPCMNCEGGGQNEYILPINSSDIWSVKSTWQNLPWNRYPTNKQSPIEHTCTIDLKQVKSEWSIVFQLASQHDILQLVSFNKSCQYWD